MWNRYVYAGVLCLLLAAAGTGGSAMAGQDSEKSLEELLADYRFGAEVRRSELSKEQSRKRSELAEKYAAAVEKAAEDFQKNGDLDSLLLARKEIDHVRKHQRLPETEFPALASLRKIFNDQLSVINEAEAKANGEWAVGEIPRLEALKVELTKANRLDDAVAIKREIDRLIASVEKGESDISGPAIPAPTEGSLITDHPIASGEEITEDLKIEPGIYDLAGQMTTIGIRSTPDVKPQAAHVKAGPGVGLQSGKLYVAEGSFTGTRNSYNRVDFSGNLSALISVEDSLFQDCTMAKGGSWFTKIFSSKWVFKNCAFAGSFFTQWNTRQSGVQIEDCTFHDIEFNPIQYQEDAATESGEEWMTIKNCRFVNCEVPESLLIATDDCVFENCTFTGPDYYPTTRHVTTTISVTGALPAEPPTGDNARIEVKIISPLNVKAGADLDYEYIDGTLRTANR